MNKAPRGTILLSLFLFAAAMCGLASCSRPKIDQIDDAVQTDDLEKIKALIKGNPALVFSKAKDSDPATAEHPGWTPLHFAAASGHTDAAQLLLANKAEVDAKDDFGETPFFLAAGNGQTGVAKLLMASNADINATSAGTGGETPLELAAGAGDEELAKILLAKNVGVNTKDGDGITALDQAAAGGHKEIVALLLANKADVNPTNNGGETPLKRAEIGGFRDVAEFLRLHGGHEYRVASGCR